MPNIIKKIPRTLSISWYLLSSEHNFPLPTAKPTKPNQARSANQCPVTNMTTPSKPSNKARDNKEAPTLTHQVGKVGLKAVKNIPPNINPEPKLLFLSIDSLIWLALKIICNPITIRTTAPNIDRIVNTIFEPMKCFKPNKIKTTITASINIWPKTIKITSFAFPCSTLEIAKANIGPGNIAPERPTIKPMINKPM